MRRSFPTLASSLILVLASLACTSPRRDASSGPLVVTIAYDSSQRFQTMQGWGGEIPNLHWYSGDQPQYSGPTTPFPEALRLQLLEEVVNDLGCTSFSHNVLATQAWPQRSAPPDFSNVDPYIREFLIPLRDLVRARGEVPRFSVKIFTAAPMGRGPRSFIADNAEDYADFAEATVRHFRDSGIEVSYLWLENEPDLVRGWTPAKYGKFVAVIGARLRAAGFATRIAGPETMTPASVAQWLGAAANTPGAMEHLGLISYHSYDYDPTIEEMPSIASRISVANWARELHLPVAMTEQSSWGRKNPRLWDGMHAEQGLQLLDNLYADLVDAQAGEWWYYLIFGVSWTKQEMQASYFQWQPDFSGYARAMPTPALRQFMHYVRPGAVRVMAEVQPEQSPVRATGFLSAQGRAIVVAYNRGEGPCELKLNFLPAGRYRYSVVFPAHLEEEYPARPLAPGETLSLLVPAGGVVTIWQR